MEFIFKKSTELTVAEKEQLCALFRGVFNKQRSLEQFERQIFNASVGFSYHGIMVVGDKIVGNYTTIPFKYKYFNQECLFALSVDTMIDAAYRGNPFNLKKIATLVYNALVADGIPFVFGFPNENIYLVRKKILKWLDIGKLSYYLLPIRFEALSSKLKFFNPFSSFFANLVNIFPKDISNCHSAGNGEQYNIEKINSEDFMNYRYDNSYEVVKLNDNTCFIYKIGLEDNIKIAYLIDVIPLDKQLFESAVKYIFHKHQHDIAAIGYIGKLNFKPINMLKVPGKFAPKTLHMAGKILIEGVIDNRIFNIHNWNVNLSNFDAR